MYLQTYRLRPKLSSAKLTRHWQDDRFYVYDDYTIRAQNDEESVLNWKTIVSSILIDNRVVPGVSRKVFIKYAGLKPYETGFWYVRYRGRFSVH